MEIFDDSLGSFSHGERVVYEDENRNNQDDEKNKDKNERKKTLHPVYGTSQKSFYHAQKILYRSGHRILPAPWSAGSVVLAARQTQTHLDCRGRRSGATGLRPLPAGRRGAQGGPVVRHGCMPAVRPRQGAGARWPSRPARLAVRNVAGNMATLRPDGMKQVNGEGCRGRHSLLSVAQVQAYVDSYEGRDVNPAGTPRRNPLGPRC